METWDCETQDRLNDNSTSMLLFILVDFFSSKNTRAITFISKFVEILLNIRIQNISNPVQMHVLINLSIRDF
jgi:hypothetical protein